MRRSAIATKLAPFAALAVWPASGAPWWAAAVLAGIGLLQIATDIGVGTKSSDWKKFRREKAIARERRAALEPGAPRGTGADHRRSRPDAGTALPSSPCRSSGSPVETGPHIAAPVGCVPWTWCVSAT